MIKHTRKSWPLWALLVLVASIACARIGFVALDATPASTTRVNNLEITGTTDATGVVTARAGMRLTTPTTGPLLTAGAGDPNGVVTATIGSLYLRTTGQLYQNTDGATTWALVGVTDGDKGDITVSASGATWTIDNSVVTLAKMADLAQSTIIGRAAGAGLGTPTALTAAQATAILDTFTAGAKGLVPASGGGTTNFLRADGTWTSPSGGTTRSDLIFGPGTDGAETFDGVNPVEGMVPAGNVYTLSRNFYFEDMTVDPAVTIHTNGFFIQVRGTLTGGGTIMDFANPGSVGTNVGGGAGGTARAARWFPQTNTGGAGQNAAGGGGTSVSTSWAPFFATGVGGTGGAIGTDGSDGITVGTGGGGGGGAGAVGGNGGQITTLVTANSITADTEAIWRQRAGNAFGGGVMNLGTGGGGGAGWAGGWGGGGGAAGGYVLVSARTIGNITLKAPGGDGGQGGPGDALNESASGGGGGGGGLVIVYYETVTGTLSATAPGGLGGPPGADSGGGLGWNGGDGAAGVVVRFNLSGDGT